MKVSWIFSACNGLLAFFALSTNASPVGSTLASPSKGEKATLQTRQAGTYDGHDDLEPALAGTYHCFKGGTWMAQSQINGTLDQACAQTSFDHDASHFNFTLDANGTNAHQQVDHLFRHCHGRDIQHPASIPTCDIADKAYVSYQADFKSATFANTDDCRYAMRRIIDLCHGKKQYTRGGWWQFDEEGTTYNVDPQTIEGH